MFSVQATYTMSDLTRATGFTARQIRYYITRKLVPGAGGRGPNVTYGQETLDRLQLVKRLKDVQVEPTGRSLTLDEIKASMESLGTEGATQLADGVTQLSIIDTDDMSVQSEPFEATILRKRRPEPHFVCSETSAFSAPLRADDLASLLDDFEELLTDILDHTELPSGADQWRRLQTPDIEIQVRIPDGAQRRRNLGQILKDLKRLIEHGRYEP